MQRNTQNIIQVWPYHFITWVGGPHSNGNVDIKIAGMSGRGRCVLNLSSPAIISVWSHARLADVAFVTRHDSNNKITTAVDYQDNFIKSASFRGLFYLDLEFEYPSNLSTEQFKGR